MPAPNEPNIAQFAKYFEELDRPQSIDYFDKTYEEEAITFLDKYDDNDISDMCAKSTESYIINSNFTRHEIENAIDYLRTNKAPGTDVIPAEMIKYCKSMLSEPIKDAFNYIIERKEFPQSWCEGLRSAVYKSGKRNGVENYRGITILPILEKIFEIAVYKRLSFANQAFARVDENNGGFLPGRRTTDNLFIINGLIQKQLILGKSLVLCFVDFSMEKR